MGDARVGRVALAVLALLTPALCAGSYVGVGRYLARAELRIQKEVAERLDTEQQRFLRAQLIENDAVWLITTATSASGLPYAHGLFRYLGTDAAALCERDRATEQERAYQAGVTIGSHYMIHVSECRRATLKLDNGKWHHERAATEVLATRPTR